MVLKFRLILFLSTTNLFIEPTKDTDNLNTSMLINFIDSYSNTEVTKKFKVNSDIALKLYNKSWTFGINDCE